MLEDSLANIARQEQAIRLGGRKSGKKP